MTNIEVKSFGKVKGGEALLYTLTNNNGASVSITNQGGCIVSIIVPDKNGNFADVALGYETGADYEVPDRYIAALIGRNSNRIENSEFTLNGKTYKLYANNGRNNLHGGKIGFNMKLWESSVEGDKVIMKLYSPDGEEGFPANLEVTVKYSFDDENALKIDYFAVSDGDTVCNLTNHCYFNLGGHNSGDILSHKLKINASYYTEANEELLPTGVIASVKDTPFDFTDFHTIGERIDDDHIQLKNGGGYDHNFCCDGEGFRLIAELWHENSGRLMEMYTDLPGVQLYTGNFMNDTEPMGKNGATYGHRNGVCLEAQVYPNALRHPHFPTSILKKGETYRQTTVYKFSVK